MFDLIAFDLDGTLIELNIPFEEIRKRLGIRDRFILEAILKMEENKRSKALKVLEYYETKCAENAKLIHFAKELIDALNQAGITKGVITRNCRRSVEVVSKKFDLKFDFVITREDAKPKPSPEPVILALKMFNISRDRALIVGDFVFDLIAGKKAGIKTALIITDKNREIAESYLRYADYVFKSLKELAEFLGVI